MRVRFWGTRGSIATPGPETIHFGGNTSCVEVCMEAGGRVIFDCGTGARALGLELITRAPKPISAAILLSHTHWDHIQGFPFFAPIFLPGSKISVYAPEGAGRSLREVMAGQMETTYFPVELEQLPAEVNYFDLSEGTYEVSGFRTTVQYLNHPAVTLGYRVEAGGVKLLYICDHEPFSPTLWRGEAVPGKIESILHTGDRRHAEFLADADLVIHDAQYTPEEYPAKKNWGHSTFEYVVGVAAAAGVKRLALTHHDPSHDDAFIYRMEERARKLASGYASTMEVLSAYEGCELTLQSSEVKQPSTQADHPTTLTAAQRILLVDDDPDLRLLARKSLSKKGYRVTEAASGSEALQIIGEERPDLIVLDVNMPEMDGLQVLNMLRSTPVTKELPVLMLTSMGDEVSIHASFKAGATDYLTKPFSPPQLAARVFACLSRSPSG